MKGFWNWLISIFKVNETDYYRLIEAKNEVHKQKMRLDKIKEATEMIRKSNMQQDPKLRKIYYEEGQRLKREFDLLEKSK